MHADWVPPWTVRQCTFISWWDHWSSATLDTAIGTGFYKLLLFFAISYMLCMSKFYMPTLINHRNISKQHPLAFILFDSHAGVACFKMFNAIFSMVNWLTSTSTRDTRLFHILTSFVCVGPLDMLTTSAVSWAVNTSRRFRSVSSPNVVSGVSGRKYPSKRQSDIALHKRIHIYG